VRDAGGKWYLDPHERTSFGGGDGSGSEDDSDDDESESGQGVIVAAPPTTKETV